MPTKDDLSNQVVSLVPCRSNRVENKNCPVSEKVVILGTKSRSRRTEACVTQTEQKVCFNQVCGVGNNFESKWIRPQSVEVLPEPQPLSAEKFKFVLQVGPWEGCKNERKKLERPHKTITTSLKSWRVRKRRSTNKKTRFPGLKKWSPQLPSELEISFVASSLSPPATGIERRKVLCRGKDGEDLPFR